MGQEIIGSRLDPDPRQPALDEDAALRVIVEGTATETGEAFFAALVKNLALALGTQGAWVTEYLNLDRALPRGGRESTRPRMAQESEVRVRTVQQLEALERDNLQLALETAGWKVAGEKGAARLLGMHPNTLASRMKALGLTRPRS